MISLNFNFKTFQKVIILKSKNSKKIKLLKSLKFQKN